MPVFLSVKIPLLKYRPTQISVTPSNTFKEFLPSDRQIGHCDAISPISRPWEFPVKDFKSCNFIKDLKC